jgi:DNA-damage-inducible protein D
MKAEMIRSLMQTFESAAHLADDVEFWYARDLQVLLGYTKWDNFLQVLDKAKTACQNSGQQVDDHFADVGKMVDIGSATQREIGDVMLTRYACYLIAQSGVRRGTHRNPRQSFAGRIRSWFHSDESQIHASILSCLSTSLVE